MNFAAIPAEMKFYRQWIVWRLEDHGGPKPTKVPYSPIAIGAHASVDKPSTWGTFEDAVAAFEAGGFSGIGFVLTEGDPFVFIDLDDTKGNQVATDRQLKIFSDIPSYAERSPSGTGLHIIGKASVPRGRKRENIEVYSSLRFMTMTGDVYRDAPIVECQEAVSLLWHQMGGPASINRYKGDAEAKDTDEQVKGKALSAMNGDKFAKLYEGGWEEYYSSQSEGDFALVDIIAFYTQNRAQIARMFRASELGKRDKAKRDDYVNFMIDKAFDRMLEPVDAEGLNMMFADMAAEQAEQQLEMQGLGNGAPEGPSAPPYAAEPGKQNAAAGMEAVSYHGAPVNNDAIVFPPGLVGEVAQFIYDQAPRPVREIALVGAIGFVGGLVGKAYNVSNTGLNIYVLCLAATGTGKEAINSGVSKLVSACAKSQPAILNFIGPGETRSDAALIKWLTRAPSIYSIQGEWGMRLKQMASPFANSNEIGVKKVIMDLFNKSGQGNILNPMAYSDKTNNTPPIPSPAFSLIGESTPEKFYEVLDETLIADGFLPRFLTIEYKGPRPPMSKSAATAVPTYALIDMVTELTTHVIQLIGMEGVVNVGYDAYAEKLLDDFDKFSDAHINDGNANEVVRHMWNRAHVKALKLAGLVAVGVNPYAPIIDRDMARWACDIVAKDIVNVIDRFVTGEIGSAALGAGEQKQIDAMIKTISLWMKDRTGFECGKYNMPGNMHAAGIILGSSLNKRLMAMAAFRNDKIGATNAIKRTIQHLLDGDELRELPRRQMQDTFGTSARGFIISRPATFL